MRKKQRSPQTNPVKARGRYGKAAASRAFSSPLKLLFSALAVVATLLTLYSYRPKITIAPAATIDPSNPFSTAFEVKNASEFLPLIDGHAGCDGSIKLNVLHGARNVTPKFQLSDSRWSRLDAGKSLTTFCKVAIDFGVPNSELRLDIAELTLTMKVAYSIPLLPYRFHDEWPYTYVRGKDGLLHWLAPMALNRPDASPLGAPASYNMYSVWVPLSN